MWGVRPANAPVQLTGPRTLRRVSTLKIEKIYKCMVNAFNIKQHSKLIEYLQYQLVLAHMEFMGFK